MSKSKINKEVDLELKIMKKLSKTNKPLRKNKLLTQIIREDLVGSLTGKNNLKDIPVREEVVYYKSSDY